MNRRRALKLFAGGATGVGAATAIHNSVIGFGLVSGTNLREQDLHPLFAQRLRADDYTATVGSTTLALTGEHLEVAGEAETDTLPLGSTSREDAAALDDHHGFADAPVEQLVADVPRLRAGEFTLAPAQYPDFFERLREGSPRAFSVGALRGQGGANPDTVERFVEDDPSDTETLVEALAAAFREHSYYDTPRFLAGSIEDNVLFGRRDLRAWFRSPTDFESIRTGETSGLFCTELTRRSGDAFHAVPAHEATVPVAAVYVRNHRHKHVYTGLASLLEADGELVMPVTFVDYRDSTLNDDLRLRRVLGEGLAAYDTRHRADDIYWRW